MGSNGASQRERQAFATMRNLKLRKRDAARTILESDAYRNVPDATGAWDALETIWLTVVGEHKNDMQCGILMHALHTKDIRQLEHALKLISE